MTNGLIMKITVWYLLLIHLITPIAAVTFSKPIDELVFPDPIPGANFSKEMSKGLHLVDFFSPYCSHCKHLEPTWKKAWKEFASEYSDLDLTFSRVDCVASGDTCNQENIEYYPTIRLYGPEGAIKNYPSDYQRTVEDLIKFAKAEALNPDNYADASLVSKSVGLTDNDVIQLLAGGGKSPYLISFWPTDKISNKELEAEFIDCAQCTPFKRIWKLLSNRLLGDHIKTGHVSCVKSSTLCKELGFDNLVPLDNDSNERDPRVALILPDKKSNNLFIFPKKKVEIDSKVYEDFATRITHNNNAPHISKVDIFNMMQKDINFNEASKNYIKNQEIHLVFSYDPKTVVPEDFDVLEHLIAPLQDLPNVFLHQINESLIDVTNTGYKNMYTMIKNNDPESDPLVLNENSLVLNTITQLPTFFIFRDGDVTSQVFPGYSSTETRNAELILSWVSLFAKPLYSEVTPKNFNRFIEQDRDVFSSIVLLIANSTDSEFVKHSAEWIKNINISGYEYEHDRLNEMYDNILKERADKQEYIAYLQSIKAKPDKVVDATLLDVAHVNNLRLSQAYYDLAEYDENMSWLKKTLFKESLKAGDVVVIDRLDGRVFQHDSSGNVTDATSIPRLRDILLSVSLPDKTNIMTPKSVLLTIKKHESNNKKSASNISSTSNKVYLLVIVVVSILLATRSKRIYRKYRTNKSYKNKRDTVGILGKNEFQD